MGGVGMGGWEWAGCEWAGCEWEGCEWAGREQRRLWMEGGDASVSSLSNGCSSWRLGCSQRADCWRAPATQPPRPLVLFYGRVVAYYVQQHPPQCHLVVSIAVYQSSSSIIKSRTHV